MAVKHTPPRSFRLSSLLIKQSIDISPEQYSRQKRFLHHDDSRETGLRTYDKPSCGSIHVLRWLHENKFEFEDLMKCRETAKFVLCCAIVGIRDEGTAKNKIFEADQICKYLTHLLKNDQSTTSDIGKHCVYLYTRNGFLFTRVNQILRGKCLIKSRNLAPYCALLSAYLQKRCFQEDKFISLSSHHTYVADRVKILYRGADLTGQMIEEYRQKVGQRISWSGFSSTTKNREVAEMFGSNTIFTINATIITSISTDYLADIHKFSKFPEEEEVLLAAGINLVIGKVSQARDGKYDILLYVSDNYERQIPKIVSVPSEYLHFRRKKKWKNTWMEDRVGPVNGTFIKGLLAPYTIPHHKSEPVYRTN